MGLFDKLFNNGLNSVKSAIENAGEKEVQAEASAEVPEEQSITLRFGSHEPVKYDTVVHGKPMTLDLKLNGTAKVSVSDSEVSKSCGGLKALENTLRAEIVAAGHEAIRRYSDENIPVARLQAYMKEIEDFISSKTESEWQSKYGVRPDKVSVMGILMTEESKNIYNSALKS